MCYAVNEYSNLRIAWSSKMDDILLQGLWTWFHEIYQQMYVRLCDRYNGNSFTRKGVLTYFNDAMLEEKCLAYNFTSSSCLLPDGGDMTRELVEIRGLVVKDMKIGAGVFAAILTVGKWITIICIYIVIAYMYRVTVEMTELNYSQRFS